jgi:hypothetical protein
MTQFRHCIVISITALFFGFPPRSYYSDTAPPSRTQLRLFARETLRLAESKAAMERAIEYRVWAVTQIATAWSKLEPRKTRKMLLQAWESSKRVENQNDRGIRQSDIVLLGWTTIDVSKARKMSRQISEPYWRDFAMEFLPQHAAVANPARGPEYLKTIADMQRRSDFLTQAAWDLVRDYPDSAISLVKNAPVSNRGDHLGTLVAAFAMDDLTRAKQCLELIRDVPSRDSALFNLAVKMSSRSPKEAEVFATRITDPQQKCVALAHVAHWYWTNDPNKAKRLAGVSLSLAAGLKKDFHTNRILAELANLLEKIDNTSLKKILLETTSSFHADGMLGAVGLMALAGAWAHIDPARGKVLYEKSIEVYPNICVGPHGEFLSEEFCNFLEVIGDRQPETAARYFKDQVGKTRNADFEVLFVGEAIAKRDRNNALSFVTICGGKVSEKKLLLTILKNRASDDPANAARLLQGIRDHEERDFGAEEVAIKLSSTHIVESLEVARTIKDFELRARALGEIARLMLRMRDPRATQLLAEARDAALQAKRAFGSATGLADLASIALVAAERQRIIPKNLKIPVTKIDNARLYM